MKSYLNSSNYNKSMVNNKFLFIFIFLMLFTTLASAQLEQYGTFKQNDEVRLSQVCSDATYINISGISYPNGTLSLSNIEMTPSGSGEFYYNFNLTEPLGRYDVRGVSDGCEKTFATYFEVTATGYENYVGTYIILFLLIIGLLIGLILSTKKFNRQNMKKLYKKIVDSYFEAEHNEDKNMGETILFALFYGLMKNIIVAYYLVGVLFLFILVEFLQAFGISSLLILMATLLNVFLWGFILVFLIFIFRVYRLFMVLINDIKDSLLGVGNDFG
jgi:hypothetical protein